MKTKLYLLAAAILLLTVGCHRPKVLPLTPTNAPVSSAPTADPTTPEPKTVEIALPVQTEGDTPTPTAEPTPENTPEPTPEPTPSPTPEPVTEEALVRVNEAGVVGRIFALGETVTVTAEQGDYYLAETESGTLLVEKWLIRMDNETAPKSYTGYARNNIPVYGDVYMEGDRLDLLGLNVQVTVEDAFGQLLRIRLKNGTEGYTLASNISKTRIAVGGGNSGGQDGGDIPLGAVFGQGSGVVRLGGVLRASSGFAPGLGTILAEGTEGYIALFDRGDTVRVLEKGADSCVILLEEGQGTMFTSLLRFDGDSEYEAWTGYARSNAPLHRHWRMLDEETKLKANTVVRVIGELNDRYIVEVGGELGYIPQDKVSKTKITGGGGGGGGGDWTDPVL